jgi:hypothetical protein
LEVIGFGFSFEQPAATEHTIRTAAKTNAFTSPWTLVGMFLIRFPHASSARVVAELRNPFKLMRVIVGHLLPASGTRKKCTEEAKAASINSVGITGIENCGECARR